MTILEFLLYVAMIPIGLVSGLLAIIAAIYIVIGLAIGVAFILGFPLFIILQAIRGLFIILQAIRGVVIGSTWCYVKLRDKFNKQRNDV